MDREKTNNNNNENSSIHATKKHKTNAISQAFTIEAIVISEVFTFCVLVDELAACNAAYRCFNADTDSFLFIESIIIVVCVSKSCVCNEMAMQLVINYPSVYRFDVSFLYVDKYIFLDFVYFPSDWAVDGANGNLRDSNCRSRNCKNANKRSKFYLLISVCFVFFLCLVQFILVEQGEKKRHARTICAGRFKSTKEICRLKHFMPNEQTKYGTLFL